MFTMHVGLKVWLFGLISLSGLMFAPLSASAQSPASRRPSYQRSRYVPSASIYRTSPDRWGSPGFPAAGSYYYPRSRHAYRYQQPYARGQSQMGWYQRPYPYHLDYYKNRWSGSYAPYQGNGYEPPVGYTPAPAPVEINTNTKQETVEELPKP